MAVEWVIGFGLEMKTSFYAFVQQLVIVGLGGLDDPMKDGIEDEGLLFLCMKSRMMGFCIFICHKARGPRRLACSRP